MKCKRDGSHLAIRHVGIGGLFFILFFRGGLDMKCEPNWCVILIFANVGIRCVFLFILIDIILLFRGWFHMKFYLDGLVAILTRTLESDVSGLDFAASEFDFAASASLIASSVILGEVSDASLSALPCFLLLLVSIRPGLAGFEGDGDALPVPISNLLAVDMPAPVRWWLTAVDFFG